MIAGVIQKGIARMNQTCDIARLKEITPAELENYDLIGIGSPVWSTAPTPNVLTFINNLPSSLNGKQAFFFCTHGTLPGRSILTGVKALHKQNLIVIGWKDWYAGVCLAGHAKPYFTDGHPDAIDLAEAETFGSTLFQTSLKISRGAADLIPALPEDKPVDEIFREGNPGLPSDRPEAAKTVRLPPPLRGELRINPEKCTGCMLCADNCVCNHIDSGVSPPVFKTGSCVKCLYCEGICPDRGHRIRFLPSRREYFISKSLPKAPFFGRV